MARGIPDIPLDGETYASVGVAGLPMVLEYDGPTGGYKLVVSTEAGVAINISGTVEVTGGQLTVVGGAEYGEDTPHTSGQTGTFIMGVRQDALASAVSADGDYAGLQLDSLGRLRVLSYGSNFLAPLNSSQYAEDSMFVGGMTGTFILAVRNDQMGSYASDDGDFSTLNTDILGRLYTWTTGSYVFADTELPPAAALADATANPTVPGVGSHLMIWDEGDSEWDRARSTIAPELDGIAEGTVSPALAASAFGMGFDPVAGDWNRIRLDAVTGAQLVGITGTVSMAVESDLPLVFTEDEVTAYITGSTSLNLMGKTITRAVINFSGSAASETALVAAVGGQQIKVLELMLIGNADVSIFLQSGYTGTALTGPMSLPADGDGFFVETPAQMEAHHFETLSGEALVLDISANVLLGGWINYYAE